jgi:hypothetical protein
MTHALPMRVFAETFFTHFGATLTPRPDEIVVDLPPRLADHFGKPRLYLIFPAEQKQGRDLSPHEDLLVYGSRVFEGMLALLTGQGETACLQLPRQVSADIEAMPVPSLRRPQIQVTEVENTARQVWYYLFNFRVVYVSDEKEESFITVAVDDVGRPVPALLDLFQQTAPLPTAPESTSLLPATRLLKLAEQAGEEVRQIAARRAVELEQSGRVRLEKILLRLTAYYRRRIDEVDTGDAAEDESVRADLQHDLEQKIADEMIRHRWRVIITPVSYAAVLLPTVHYRLTVTVGAPVVSVPVQKLVSGPPVSPPKGVNWRGFRWEKADGADYDVYAGHHFWRGVAVVVLDKHGKLIAWRQAGWRNRILSSVVSPSG